MRNTLLRKLYFSFLCLFLLWGLTPGMAQTYDSYELDKLRAFLRQPSATAGKINAEKLGLTIADTTDWDTATAWVSKIPAARFGWVVDGDGVSHLKSVSLNTAVASAGVLNFSNFKYLEMFDLYSANLLTKIDLSGCTALKGTIDGFPTGTLTSLNISGCIKLEKIQMLNCRQFKEFNMSNTGGLISIVLQNVSSLPSLDCAELVKNTNLTTINFNGATLLTGLLDLTGLTKLTSVNISFTSFTGLKLDPGASALTSLYVQNNANLTELDVSMCPNLTSLQSGYTSISHLDLSACTATFSDLRYQNCKFRISTMPPWRTVSNIANYMFAPQPDIDFGYIKIDNPVDLSAEILAVGVRGSSTYTTVFTWKKQNSEGSYDPIPEESIVNNNGKFLFTDRSLLGIPLICEMTNAAFWDSTATGGYQEVRQLTLVAKVTLVSEGMTHNEDELNLLRAFLRQRSADNFRSNAEVLGVDTLAWMGSDEWAATIPGITWEKVGDIEFLKDINWDQKELGGKLNLSGCNKLVSLTCEGNKITEIVVDNNPNLKEIACRNNLLSLLKTNKCPVLKIVHCDNNQLKFSTLQPPLATFTDFTYQNQDTLRYNVITTATRIDLSSEFEIADINAVKHLTVYTWYDITSGTATQITTGITDVDNAGIFTVDNSLAGKTLLCAMTNPVFQALTIYFKVKVVQTLEYDKMELAYLMNFMRATSAIKTMANGEHLGLSTEDITYFNTIPAFDISEDNGVVSALDIQSFWVPKVHGVEWLYEDNKCYLKEIHWAEKQLSGEIAFKDAPAKMEVFDVSSNQLTSVRLGIGIKSNYTSKLKTALLNNNPKIWNLSVFCTNDLETIEVTNSANIEKITLINVVALKSIDLSTQRNLSVLQIDNSSIDQENIVKNCHKLQSLVIQESKLSTINLSENILLTEASLGVNQLQSLDVSKNTELGLLAVSYNRLESINLSKNRALKDLYIMGNKFRLSTLPSLEVSSMRTYNYMNQDTIQGGTKLCGEEITDLENEYSINNMYGTSPQTTTYKWYYLNGSEKVLLTQNKDYEESRNGVFVFLPTLNGKKLYCEMTNTNYPKLTQMYTVSLNGISSSTALLDDLIIHGATLSPSFNSMTFDYTLVLECSANNKVNITATPPTGGQVSYFVNGAAVSMPYTMTSMQTVLTIRSTSSDGTQTKDYTITVTRPFQASEVIAQLWDDVLSVINVPANNGGYTFNKYQWYEVSDVTLLLAGETGGNLDLSKYSKSKSASYFVELTTTDNIKTKSCEARVSSNNSPLQVYPNPARGIVKVNNIKAGCKIIEVYTISGARVASYPSYGIESDIDVSTLPNGIYIIKSGNETTKLIKQ